MITVLMILFIIECVGFAYLYYLCLEINKDINTLYDNYSKELEKITKENLKIRKEFLR